MATRTYARTFLINPKTLDFDKVRAGMAANNYLFNFALARLYKTFGVKTRKRRHFPQTTKAKQALCSQIRREYMIARGCHGVRRYKTEDGSVEERMVWDQAKAGISSKEAESVIEPLITNFQLYLRTRNSMSRLPEKHKANYTRRTKKAWYAKGRIKHRSRDARSPIVLKQNCSGIRVVGSKEIRLPSYGTIVVDRPLPSGVKIRQARMKVLRLPGKKKPAIVQLQLVLVETAPKKQKVKSKVGLDWGMHKNAVYTEHTDEVHIVPDEVISRADALEKKIRSLQAQLNVVSPSRRVKIQARIRKLHAKRSFLLDDYYIKLAQRIAGQNQYIAIEDLGPKTMRRKGGVSPQSKGFNRKLALLKPGRLRDIMSWICVARGVTLALVDPYKTSQVEFGTDDYHIEKHDLSEREWISSKTGRTIKRDPNAANNTLYWSENPHLHYKVVERERLIAEGADLPPIDPASVVRYL